MGKITNIKRISNLLLTYSSFLLFNREVIMLTMKCDAAA